MKFMSGILFMFLALGAMPAMVTARQSETTKTGSVTVTKTYKPLKQLDFEVHVPAKPTEVWTALTTAEGLQQWLAPQAEVQLKTGGDWIVRFPGGSSTAGGTILEFVDGKSLTLSAMAPDAFPTVRSERTRAVFEIRPADHGKTCLVRMTQTGWKTGDEWDRAFDYLAQGNASLLEQLRSRFVNGPIDWEKLFKKKE